MKILVLNVIAGHGHTATAKSVENSLLDAGAHVDVVDVYRQVNKLLSETIDKSTILYAKLTPDIYRAVYAYLDTSVIDERFNVVGLINMLCTSRFDRLLREYAPDVIFCTHVFSAQLANELKRRGKTDATVIGVCTDYTVHPFWEAMPHIEYIVLANEGLLYKASKKGIPERKLLPLGIPIDRRFSQSTPRALARERLLLPTDGRVILTMGGGDGFGIDRAVIEKILSMGEKISVIVVCGKNKRLYGQFMRMRHALRCDRLHVYGFTDHIDVMMDAADVLISKPGGLTVTEAINKTLPLVVVNPIAGHEERNLEYLLNMGLCVSATSSFPVDEAVHLLFSDPGRLESIRSAMRAVAKPDAAEHIASFIMGLRERERPTDTGRAADESRAEGRAADKSRAEGRVFPQAEGH